MKKSQRVKKKILMKNFFRSLIEPKNNYMKQCLIFLCILILASLTSKAQLKLGITGGIDYSKTNIHRLYQDDFGILGKATYHFGLSSEYKVNENVYLTTDLLFTQKGFTQPTSQATTGNDFLMHNVSDINVSVNYIEIPVLSEFKVNFDKMNVFFGVGPYIAYGIDGKIKLNIESGSNIYKFTDKIYWSKYDWIRNPDLNKSIVYNLGQANIQRFDYGPVVRFGIEYKSLKVNAEYKYGLANVMYEWSKYESMHNESLGLSVKYLFNLKKL